jgi:hypothetical protein
MNIEDFKNHKNLWFRICYAAHVLTPVQSKYCAIFEDSDNFEERARILIPDPYFVAAALQGGVLPDISSHIADQNTRAEYEQEHGSLEGFNWRDHKPQHPYAKPHGPMNHEEIIEYAIQKNVDPKIWRDYKGNRQILKIVPVSSIPKDRSFRNAWVISQDNEELETAA